MARYRKIVTKTVDEWLAIRKPLIGGSEISAVIGINPWESRYELYLRKKGDIAPKEENLFMKIGHKLENGVAELLQEEVGYQIIKNTRGNLIFLSADYPFAEASPDRIAYLPGAKKSEENKIIVEIKTTQKAIDEDALPEHWICQVQWYMGITGIHRAVISWLVSGRDFGYKEIPFNEEFFKFLAEEGREFDRCLREGIVPDAVTARDIDAKYPRQIPGNIKETNEEVAIACERYKQIKSQIKELEEELSPCEETIKLAIAEAEGISYGGLCLATYKAGKDVEKFDAKAFKEANPELAGQYTKIIPAGRRLHIIK